MSSIEGAKLNFTGLDFYQISNAQDLVADYPTGSRSDEELRFPNLRLIQLATTRTSTSIQPFLRYRNSCSGPSLHHRVGLANLSPASLRSVPSFLLPTNEVSFPVLPPLQRKSGFHPFLPFFDVNHIHRSPPPHQLTTHTHIKTIIISDMSVALRSGYLMPLVKSSFLSLLRSSSFVAS